MTQVVQFTVEEFRSHLQKLAEQVGSMAEVGRRLNISGQLVGRLIAGKQKPGPKVLKAIGARRKLMFEIDVESE